MVTTDTAVDALSAALNLARAEGRIVHSMKDLLCDACGEGAALRAGGFCHRCADEMGVHHAARAEADAAAMLELLDDPARFLVGDDEGELLARGIRC